MDKIMLVFPVLVILSIGSVIKIANMIYRSMLKKNFQKEFSSDSSLINAHVSYQQFTNVAKESLNINSPIREQDDFLDFMIEHIDSDSKNIENNILRLNYGE